jgi:methionine sulfoxide reductase heme-binding subunit
MSSMPSTSPVSVSGVRKAVKLKSNWLRLGVHLVGIFALVQLVVIAQTSGLTANPIQFVEQRLGLAAANMLVLALAVTPIVTVTGWRSLSKYRRALGLYAFFYFALHFLTFAVVDYGLDWREILLLTTEKPFIIVGLLAGLILLALAITSFPYWMKRLGRNWKLLHKTVYLASILVILHYSWALKGSLTTMSGDIIRPLVMGLIVALLLVLRIPPVRRRVIRLRQGVR